MRKKKEEKGKRKKGKREYYPNFVSLFNKGPYDLQKVSKKRGRIRKKFKWPGEKDISYLP